MAQRIQKMSPAPYAREVMGMSSAERGLGGMMPPNQGMTNMDDMGSTSKPYANNQNQRQLELAGQNVRQNTMSARPQAAADAMGQVRKATTEQSTAQTFMTRKATDVIYNRMEQMGGGSALMQLNSIMTSPQRESFVNNIATSKKMFEGSAPELGQVIAEANRYRA